MLGAALAAGPAAPPVLLCFAAKRSLYGSPREAVAKEKVRRCRHVYVANFDSFHAMKTMHQGVSYCRRRCAPQRPGQHHRICFLQRWLLCGWFHILLGAHAPEVNARHLLPAMCLAGPGVAGAAGHGPAAGRG